MNLKTMVAALVALTISTAAHAQQKISIVCTAVTDCGAATIAVDEGIFKRLGVDATMVKIAINSDIPAALLSNSVQFGGVTAPLFLQAVDGGLEIVAVSGASVMHPTTLKIAAVAFARKGIEIKEPKDYVGKKVGAPGFGAWLHVMFLKWLTENGVDPKKVNFVEVSLPNHNDALKSGAIDLALTGGPFIKQMQDAGTGEIATNYVAQMNRTEPIIFYAASRDWVEKNPELLGKFRQAIVEGGKIMNADHEKAAASLSKFTGQSIKLLLSNPVAYQKPDLKASDLDWYVDFMTKMKLLQTKIDLEKVVMK